MKKVLKALSFSLILSIALLQNCSAFFLGSDAYTKEEYEKAGVKWEHNTILLDEYYFNGISISQSLAESITKFYNKNEKTIEANDKSFYFDIIEFVINVSSEKDKIIRELERKYDKLWSENIKLKNKIKDLKEEIRILKETNNY